MEERAGLARRPSQKQETIRQRYTLLRGGEAR